MKTIQVYDKAMCCSTGVCGSQVDPVLPRFAADLDWLRDQGHVVERFNLAQQPQAFLNNDAVQKEVTLQGVACLPIVVVDDRIVSRKSYPTREMLATWAGIPTARTELPIAPAADACCGGSGCC